MKVIGLVSGGKDSTYNLMQCVKHGHEIVCLGNLMPLSPDVDELDSWMYQSVGHEVIEHIASCLEVPLLRIGTEGQSIQQTLNYDDTCLDKNDEVETLYYLLRKAKELIPDLEGVSSGAILSNYQRFRVEKVCSRLGLKSLCFLWQRDQKELLSEMIQEDIDAILIKVAGFGLFPKKHLGKSIKELENELNRLNKECQINVCGEGGEYETLTLDCPLFKRKIKIEKSELIIVSDNEYDPVGYLKIKELSLEEKNFPTLLNKNVLKLHFPNSKPNLNSNNQKKSDNGGKDFGHVILKQNLHPNASIQEQIFEQMSQIENILDQIYYIQIFISDMKDFNIVNEAYCQFFSVNPPSRTCIQIPSSEKRIIFDILTFNPQKIPRNVLHVSSISSWAPACIGPYSQCNDTQNIIHVAGQIPLIPDTMELLKSNIKDQIKLVLKNTLACLKVVGSDLERIISCNVFVVDMAFQDEIDIELRKNFHKNCVIYYIEVPGLPRNADLEIQPRAFHKNLDSEKLIYQKVNQVALIGFFGYVGFVTRLFSPQSENENINNTSNFLPSIVFYNLKKTSSPPLNLFPNSTLVPVNNLMNNETFLWEQTKEI